MSISISGDSTTNGPSQAQPIGAALTDVGAISQEGSASPTRDETQPGEKLCADDTLIRKPSTFEFNSPPDMLNTPRGGTIQVGELVRLHVHVGSFPNPVVVEFRDKLLLGRMLLHAEGTHLNLDEYGGYQRGVSRKHASINRADNMLQIVDLGSTNGTYLNGFKLQANQPRILRDGDELSLGHMTLRLRFV